MEIHAMVVSDTYKPAGEFTMDNGQVKKYDEKRVLGLLELPVPGRKVCSHILDMRIDVHDPKAPQGQELDGRTGKFNITEVKPNNGKGNQEVGIVGSIISLIGTVSEDVNGSAKAK